MLKALIFDVDGTLADTEMAHLAAFNHAFAEEGLDWRWDVPQYTRLLAVSGGKERIKAFWQTQAPDVRDISGAGMQDTIDRLHEIKTAAYEQAVQDGLVHMRPGAHQSVHQEGLVLRCALQAGRTCASCKAACQSGRPKAVLTRRPKPQGLPSIEGVVLGSFMAKSLRACDGSIFGD